MWVGCGCLGEDGWRRRWSTWDGRQRRFYTLERPPRPFLSDRFEALWALGAACTLLGAPTLHSKRQRAPLCWLAAPHIRPSEVSHAYGCGQSPFSHAGRTNKATSCLSRVTMADTFESISFGRLPRHRPPPPFVPFTGRAPGALTRPPVRRCPCCPSVAASVSILARRGPFPLVLCHTTPRPGSVGPPTRPPHCCRLAPGALTPSPLAPGQRGGNSKGARQGVPGIRQGRRQHRMVGCVTWNGHDRVGLGGHRWPEGNAVCIPSCTKPPTESSAGRAWSPRGGNAGDNRWDSALWDFRASLHRRSSRSAVQMLQDEQDLDAAPFRARRRSVGPGVEMPAPPIIGPYVP